MKALDIPVTDFTPRILFDPDNYYFLLEGVSRPENVLGFYSDIMDWLNEFEVAILEKNTTPIILKIEFKLNYFNSASIKAIMQVLQKLKSFFIFSAELDVHFYYDEGDEQMLEDGEEIADAVDLEFTFHEVL